MLCDHSWHTVGAQKTAAFITGVHAPVQFHVHHLVHATCEKPNDDRDEAWPVGVQSLNQAERHNQITTQPRVVPMTGWERARGNQNGQHGDMSGYNTNELDCHKCGGSEGSATTFPEKRLV